MDPKELRGLMEAYSEVYAPQEVDEAIYSEKGKAKAAEMIAKRSTPSGRAKAGKGANVSQIRQIRGSGRGDFDREGLGGTPMTPTMAKNPIKKQSYTGTGNKAARRAGLTPTREKPNAWKEDLDIFDVVLEFLQAEGFAETLEEAEWLMANVINEEAIGIILGEDAGIISGLAGLALGAKGATYAAKHSKRLRDYPKNFVKGMVDPRTYVSKKKKEQNEAFELWVNGLVEEGYDLSNYTWDEMYDIYEAEKPFPYEKVKSKQVALRDKGSAGLDRRMKMGAAVRRAKEAEKTGGSQRDAGKGWYHAKEEYVDEAQAARNNPEKYEREQSKKSAPVRGERTPMPPRGDKRREDFEKWYAKQMGR